MGKHHTNALKKKERVGSGKTAPHPPHSNEWVGEGVGVNRDTRAHSLTAAMTYRGAGTETRPGFPASPHAAALT